MKLLGLLAALTAATLLVGCAEMTGTRTAATETTVSATATVVSVDKTTRRVVLKGADGAEIGIVAGPEVQNFDQIAKGDTVTVAYRESTVLSMAAPGTPPASATIAAGRAPEGELPAGAAITQTDIVVTVVSYDPKTAIAIFRTPDGVTRRATVPPELRNFAASQAPGAQVNVSMTDAVAVAVTKA
jgi:hypothetical protein